MDLAKAASVAARYRDAAVYDVIDPDDLMWRGDRPWYFAIGRGAFQSILRALVATPLDEPRTILDLPCGHGRVGRHLRAAFPRAHMTFADLNPAAVDFCTRHLDGAGLLSEPDLTALRFEGRFDLIWMGSLLPHVDLERIRAWLGFLSRQLTDGGVLIATFHGLGSIEVHARYPMIAAERWQGILGDFRASGFGYRPYRDGMNYSYGINLSRPGVIVDAADGIAGVSMACYLERDWDDHQDVLALVRSPRDRPWLHA